MRAVVVHDFADHAGGIESGDAREIHGSFRLSRAHQHAAAPRAQAGRRGRAAPRSAGRVAGSMAARMVVARSAALMPVVVPRRASMDSVNAVPSAKYSSATSAAGSARRSGLR